MLRFVGGILLLCTLTLTDYGQRNKQKRVDFDTTAFNAKWELVRWLVKYDMVSRNTMTHMVRHIGSEVAKLGPERFCFESDTSDVWYAVYGKFVDDQYHQAFHYRVNANAMMQASESELDTAIINPYARSLRTAFRTLSASTDSLSVRLTPFIRRNTDATFTVWLLPAFEDFKAVYGGEYVYQIDASGNHLLKDESYLTGHFREIDVEKPSVVWMDYSGCEEPPLGAVYFAWAFRTFFPRIIIDTDRSVSILVKTEDDWSWVHNTKQPAESSKKEKKKKG